MTYATALALLDAFDPEEIAQRADRGIPRTISGEMLRAAASGSTPITPQTQPALDVIADRLQAADNKINSYLGTRYAVPIASPPPVLVRCACILARYYLHGENVTERIRKDYDDELKWLQAVAAGTINIGPSASGAEPPTRNTAEITSGGSVWRRDESTGFI